MRQDSTCDSPTSPGASSEMLKEEKNRLGVHLKGRYWTTSARPPERLQVWFCRHLPSPPFLAVEEVEAEPPGE